MAHYRVTYIGQGIQQFWGVERIDDQGGTALLRPRYTVRHDANAEAQRLNLLEAEKIF